MDSMIMYIADELSRAPDTQLSKCYRDKLKKLSEDEDLEGILECFKQIYEGPCGCERSSFVKELVNPEYTKRYLEDE